MIELRLLGGPSVTTDDGGRDVSGLLARPKRLALLAYLAEDAPRLHSRDTLVSLFWPDADQDHARAALRKAVHLLRADLGNSVIVTVGDDQLGCGEIWCDVAEFERALRAGDVAAALDLYRGDLLPGFFTPDAPGFERWLEDERAALRARAANAAQRCAKAHEHASFADATRYARLALTYAPDDEPTLRWLMELLDRNGDRGGALRAYEQFATRLGQELDAEPSPETKALVDRVRARRDLTSAPRKTAEVGPPSDPTPATIRQVSTWRFPTWVFVAPLILLITFGVAWVFNRGAAESTLDSRVVLVDAFSNETGDPALAPIGRMAADWLTRGLQQTGLLQVINLADSRKGVGSADDGETVEGASRAGAGMLVSGRYYRQGDRLTIQAEVTASHRGEVIKVVGPLSGLIADPTTVVEALRQQVMGVMAALVDPQMASWARSGSQPPSYQAYLEFAAGQDRWTAGDMPGAIAHFSRARGIDSSYVHPLLLSVMAYGNLGDVPAQESLLAIAADLKPTAPLDRAMLELFQSQLRGDLVRSIGPAERLSAMAGEGWTAVLIQIDVAVNRPAEAVAAARRIDPLLGWVGNSGWGFEMAGQAYHFNREYRAEWRNARRARQRWPMNLTMRLLEARALVGLGRIRDAARLVEGSWVDPGPSWLVADAIWVLAAEMRAHGFRASAASLFERLRLWVSANPPIGLAMSWQLSEALYGAGRWTEADRQLRSDRSPGDTADFGRLSRLGTLALRLGDSVEARRIETRLSAVQRPALIQPIRFERARLAAVGGHTTEAMSLLGDACSLGCDKRFFLHYDPDFDSVRHLAAFRDLAGPVARSPR